jgi:hypothetical protein
MEIHSSHNKVLLESLWTEIETLQFLFRIINKLGNALFIFTLTKELRQRL